MKWLSNGAIDRLKATGCELDLSNTKYRLVEAIGRGGMGTVYLVEDPTLERHVALKVLDIPDPQGEMAARLVQEARVLARLEHPGMVPVYDVGQLADGRVFYTMKFVRGDRLDRWLERNVSLRERLTVFQRLCEAVAFAHARHVLHRDLKPQNIMVGAFGEVLVMDWGVAKVLQEADDEITLRVDAGAAQNLAVRSPGVVPETRHGAVMGTPGYMAPEQARGEVGRVDARSDVFALGAVLAFLLRTQTHVSSPRALRAVAEKAMSVDPVDRYSTATELAAEVDRFLDGRPVVAHPEGFHVRAGRFLWRHRVAVILLLAYAVVRALVLITRRP